MSSYDRIIRIHDISIQVQRLYFENFAGLMNDISNEVRKAVNDNKTSVTNEDILNVVIKWNQKMREDVHTALIKISE